MIMFVKWFTVVLASVVFCLVEAHTTPEEECWSLPPVTVDITGYRNQSGYWISQVVVEGDRPHVGGPKAWQEGGGHVDIQHRPVTCSTGETSMDVVITVAVPPPTQHGHHLTGRPGNTHSVHVTPNLKPRIPPAGYLPLNGVGHYKVHNPQSWTAARQQCVADGGDLVNIDSNEKLQFIKSFGGGWAWIGLQERGANGVYYTVSGEVWVQPYFLIWFPGQPTNRGVSDCLLVHIGHAKIGDTPCSAGRYFICELPWY